MAFTAVLVNGDGVVLLMGRLKHVSVRGSTVCLLFGWHALLSTCENWLEEAVELVSYLCRGCCQTLGEGQVGCMCDGVCACVCQLVLVFGGGGGYRRHGCASTPSNNPPSLLDYLLPTYLLLHWAFVTPHPSLTAVTPHSLTHSPLTHPSLTTHSLTHCRHPL